MYFSMFGTGEQWRSWFAKAGKKLQVKIKLTNQLPCDCSYSGFKVPNSLEAPAASEAGQFNITHTTPHNLSNDNAVFHKTIISNFLGFSQVLCFIMVWSNNRWHHHILEDIPYILKTQNAVIVQKHFPCF